MSVFPILSQGFTLVELMVVLAIVGVLTAIVFPAVTGATTRGKNTAQAQDINAVQTGVDRHNSEDEDGSSWPTDEALDANSWAIGELPTGTGPTGSGTESDPYVFTEVDIAGMDFVSAAFTEDGDKTFFPDFLRTLPDHNSDTITVAGVDVSATFRINKGSVDTYALLSNTTSGTLIFSVWGLDNSGGVWSFIDQDSY